MRLYIMILGLFSILYIFNKISQLYKKTVPLLYLINLKKKELSIYTTDTINFILQHIV